MKRHAISNAVALMFATMVGAGPALAAQSSSSTNTLSAQTQQMDTLGASNQGAVSDRISSDFSTFAGSTENSDALVTGLRNGTSITLTGADAKGTTTSTTFTPPTGKMGYGNVYTSMALARQNLAAVGITNPTPEQLQAALVGGTVTTSTGQTKTMTGVLELRSQGMGWGQIAQQYGYKLGPVISGMRASNAAVSAQSTHKTTITTATTSSSGTSASTKSGIVTGAGTGAGNTIQGHAYGRGIVTGAGTPGGGGQGYARGQGIVSGAGAVGGQGAGNANAGHGKALGKAN